MRSKFAIQGHPIHPALVAVPIGLFVWALIADIVYLARDRDPLWYDISFWTSIAAVVSALIAALPGFGDYFTLAAKSDARGIGLTHMILNLATVGIYGVTIALMADDNATGAGAFSLVLVLHLIGVGLLSLSGWLGGEMVFRHHVGIISDSDEMELAEEREHRLRPARQQR